MALPYNFPKISVIIPFYNAQNYIEKCLNCILQQTFKEIEIICINDGSTDNSENIIEKFRHKDNRITLINQSKENAGAARNKGIDAARGEFLCFVDADDFFELDMLEEAYCKISQDQSDIVIYGNYIFDEQTQQDISKNLPQEKYVSSSPFSPNIFKEELFLITSPNAWTKLFRKSLIDKYKLHFENLVHTNDFTFVYTAMSLAKKISILKKPLVHYRRNTEKCLTAKSYENPEYTVIAIKKLSENLKNTEKWPVLTIHYNSVKKILLCGYTNAVRTISVR